MSAFSPQQSILSAASEVADRLGLTGTEPIVEEFLACLRTADARGAVATSISDTGVPAEFSFTGSPVPPALRLLSEPVEPGGSVVSRCHLGVQALDRLIERFCAIDADLDVGRAICGLFPSADEAARLQWHAAVWLALRTDGSRSAVRAYLNVQNRPPADRYKRIMRALTALQLSASAAAIPPVAGLLGRWASPVGFSLDFVDGGIRFARLHCHIARLSYRRLSLLHASLGEEALADTMDFLKHFGITPGGGAEAVLLSVGLDDSAVTSVKCDVSLRGPDGTTDLTPALIETLQERFGWVPGWNPAGELFGGRARLRYVGLAVGRTTPYLDAYYNVPGPRYPGRLCSPAALPAQALNQAAAYAISQLSPDGALTMQARQSSIDPLLVSDGWPDLYVENLVYQESERLKPPMPTDWRRRLHDHIRRSQEHGLWRYLPQLPPDADDTAMAIISLARDGGVTGVLPTLERFIASDGGFVTFLGEPDDRSHPAVTLNVAHALSVTKADAWDGAATAAYLSGWLFGDPFPPCPWSYSPLLPLFLAARNPFVRTALGVTAHEQIVAVLSSLRRPDGTWGNAGPETLETALAVLAHDYLGRPLPHAREVATFFFETQMSDGGYCWAPLFSNGGGTWFGHRVATTVLTLRALASLADGARSVRAHGAGAAAPT